MKRNVFVLLLTLPFIGALIVPLGLLYFCISGVYLTTIFLIRLRYIGCTWRQIGKAYLLGPLIDCWWRMWAKDPN